MKTTFTVVMIALIAVLTGCANSPIMESTTAKEDAACRAAMPKEMAKAPAGNAMALYKTGAWIANGCGVDNSDLAKGFALMKQAAEKDLMVANAELGIRYAAGTYGGAKDEAKAIASTAKALELWNVVNGKGFAQWEKTALSRAVTNRGRMSKDVVAEAADYCFALTLDPANYVATKNLKIIKRTCD